MTEEEFAGLFDKYFERYVVFASSFLNRRPEAEDLVIESFELIWQRKDSFHTELKIKAFLYIHIKNRCLNTLAKTERKNTFPLLNYDIADSGNYTEVDYGVLLRLREQIALLPERRREVIELYVLGIRGVDIAKILGIRKNSMRSFRASAINWLRPKMNTPLTRLSYYEMYW